VQKVVGKLALHEVQPKSATLMHVLCHALFLNGVTGMRALNYVAEELLHGQELLSKLRGMVALPVPL
jgi:hypothetical protein